MNNVLSKTLKQAGFSFEEHQTMQFEKYFDLLYDWNKRINLTSIDRGDYLTHHLLDSLCALEHIHGDEILDMGTGGGLPGVVLAIAQPQNNFTLLDARNKKILFLNAVKHALPLDNIDPVHSRVEAHQPKTKYATVITRAFAQIDKIFKLAAPVLKQDGRIIAMKGRLDPKEMKQLDHIGVHYEVKSVEVYGLDAQRHVVTMYKDHL